MAIFSRRRTNEDAPRAFDSIRLTDDMPLPNADQDRDSPFAAASVPTIVAKAAVIKGALISEGEVQIDGRVEGQVKAPRVSVSTEGSVKGRVTAEEIQFGGKLDGTLDGGKITILRTARLKGEVIHDKIALEPGAEMDAKLISRSTLKKAEPSEKAEVKVPEPKKPKAGST